MRRLLVLLALLPAAATAFLVPSAPASPSSTRLQANTGSSQQREKRPLSWQESLELLISPTTPMAQRQVLLQVRELQGGGRRCAVARWSGARLPAHC